MGFRTLSSYFIDIVTVVISRAYFYLVEISYSTKINISRIFSKIVEGQFKPRGFGVITKLICMPGDHSVCLKRFKTEKTYAYFYSCLF